MKKFEKRINYLFHLKYRTNERFLNINIIDSIIFNEKSHFVTRFKEFLIEEDQYEFLKRYYNIKESEIRLKKYINYYNKYSLLFPNYSPLTEAIIIYKNINSKQKLIDDLQSNKKIKNMKNSNNENENLDSIVFNTKIYESIINNSENYLSIFSYDKESICDENKDGEIISLINLFDKIDSNSKKIKNNLNIDINNSNNNKIYTRKRTPNNSINSKLINISSYNLKKDLKNQIKNNKEEKEKNIYNSKNNFFNRRKGIYKKIKLNLLDSSIKKSNRSSISFKGLSRENSLITTLNTNKTTNKNSMNITALKEENTDPNQKNKIINKINDIPIKINLLTETQLIKVNTKNNNIKNKNNINNSIKNKLTNSNILNEAPKKQIIESYKNKYNINSNLIDRSISNSNINSKGNKKNISNLFEENFKNKSKKNYIIKKNNEYAQQYNYYIINNYNSKSTNYKNIKIIDTNNCSNNIIRSIYQNTPFNRSNNISDYINKTPYEKKILEENKSFYTLKKNNKTNYKLDYLLKNNNYSTSFNNTTRKKFLSKEMHKNKNFESNNSQGTSLNWTSIEKICTPFNIRQNNIFLKKNIKVNNDFTDKKNKTISKDIIKKNKKDNQSNNIIFQKKYINITNTSLNFANNIDIKNNSFITRKNDKKNNMFQNYCNIKKEKNINKRKKKDKNFTFSMNSNNFDENQLRKINKIAKKNIDNTKTFKEKIKEIKTESNEQINQYKLDLLKKFETKKKFSKNIRKVLKTDGNIFKKMK